MSCNRFAERAEPWKRGSAQLGTAKGRFAQTFMPPRVTKVAVDSETVGSDLVSSSFWSPTFLICQVGA